MYHDSKNSSNNRARVCVCVLFIGVVQRNWARLTWKSALEIKSLLYYYYYYYYYYPFYFVHIEQTFCFQTAIQKYLTGCSMSNHVYQETTIH